jgi:hypothetical protein
MSKKESISVQGTEVTLFAREKEDYLSLTDIAKYKNAEATGYVISRWLSARYTIDFVGIWERVNNPDFNVTEFSNIKNEAGTNPSTSHPQRNAAYTIRQHIRHS